MARMFSLEELEVLERNVKQWEKDGGIDGILLGSEMFWKGIKIQNSFFGMVDGITVSVGHYEIIDAPPLGSDTYKIEARIGKTLLGRKEAKNGRIKNLYEGVRGRYEKRKTIPMGSVEYSEEYLENDF